MVSVDREDINMSALAEIAQRLVAPRKGILAADESTNSIKKRLEKAGIEDSVENHRLYRQMLFTTPEIEKYISGVIMFDETFRQSTGEGEPFPDYLSRRGMVPGIKVDQGKDSFPGSEREFLTKGLEGLPERLKEYYEMGARFAKWRALFVIDEEAGLPTQEAIDQNADRLAGYGLMCQEAGILPIVEPEVLMEGKHGMDASRNATYRAQKAVFIALSKHGVDFSGMLLKTNMVHEGTGSNEDRTPEEIARHTVKLLLETVPEEIPGIVFLSGGLSPREAEDNLREMNQLGELPWELTFSYGRALQQEALKAWGGKAENVEVAQKTFLETAKRDSMAAEGHE